MIRLRSSRFEECGRRFLVSGSSSHDVALPLERANDISHENLEALCFRTPAISNGRDL